MKTYIKINDKDNVAVALCDLPQGQSVGGVTLLSNIPKGHKFALCSIDEGQDVVKYGSPIGVATKAIVAGEHVHTHNVKTKLSGQLSYAYNPVKVLSEQNACDVQVSVYPRSDVKVGIRNELWVIPLVGCVNSVAQAIVERFKKNILGKCKVDGVYAFSHPYGCSQLGEDHFRTRTLLQQMVKHPNCGGALVLGLGCENNKMSDFIATLGNYDSERVRFLIAQDVQDEVSVGAKLLEELYAVAQKDKRVQKDISCLKIGLKCGGSDGLSGITANPLVGQFSDRLVSLGGATVLTEVPEMFGAEQLLMDRAENKEVFDKIVTMVNDFKQYYADNGQPCYENPSPGNKEGGITTLEDKSLGCTQKSGSSSVVDVVPCGCFVENGGLNLTSGPGNDIVAVTNLACCGCHMVLFTTGRGTPLGGFVPTVKISTNSDLSMRKPSWIDYDAGQIVFGKSFVNSADELVKLVADVASGKQTKNEENGYRQIALFKTGVTL